MTSLSGYRQPRSNAVDCIDTAIHPDQIIVVSGQVSLDIVSADKRLIATGAWTVAQAATLEITIQDILKDEPAFAIIDLRKIDELDTFGVCLLEKLKKQAKSPVIFEGLPDRFQALWLEVGSTDKAKARQHRRSPFASIETLGRLTEEGALQLVSFLRMTGALGEALFKVLTKPSSFRLIPLFHQLDRVGVLAVPIIALITFLIGGIIAQQGIFHFRKFGADSYVVDLVGILVLREIGVLIVAIMVAGRSGSSYTAEIGSMKMREEIDALRTMGLDPTEVLLLPRVLALILALPILTLLGSMAALYGGGLVAWLYGGMAPSIFIARLKDAISITHFEVGMIKAPFMALAIGVVACSEGLAVKGSAESLGLRTTSSVVKSIFLVIVLDGFFAVFFASIGM